MKKRSFTLIEVLCSFVLTAILAGILFSYFRHVIVLKKTLVEKRGVIEQESVMQQRLTRLFLNLKGELTLEDEVLSFEFDAGVDPDPNYSHVVKGSIEQKGGDLIMTTEPLSGSGEREETLLEDIEYVAFVMEDIVEIDVDGRRFAFFMPASDEEGLVLE